MKRANPKKRLILVAATILALLLILNTAATVMIYNSIFTGYQKDVSYDLSFYEEIYEARDTALMDGDSGKLTGYRYSVDSRKLIVIAPGLHAGADDYLSITNVFLGAGYDVFAYDSTGVRKSEGNSCVGYSQETRDLDDVLTYVESNYQYSDVYLLGHSRGATAACSMLATDHKVSAIVSVSGFNSAMDAIIGLSSQYIGPLANANYPTLWLYQVILFGSEQVNFNAAEAIKNDAVPVLILQGKEDTVVSANQYSIYSYLSEDPEVESILYEGNGHTDILYAEDGTPNSIVLQDILSFLDKNESKD